MLYPVLSVFHILSLLPSAQRVVMPAELWLAALPVTWHLVLCDASRAVVGCPTSHLTPGALWCQQSCGWLPYQSSDTWCSVTPAELWLAALPVTWHLVLCDVSRAVVGCPTSHLTPGALWRQQSCGWLPYQSPDTWCSVTSAELWLAALPVTWHLVLCDASRAVVGCPTSHLTPGALWRQQSCGWLPYQSPDTWCSVTSAELWLAALPVTWHLVLCDASRAVVGCPTSHLTPGALWCQQSCGWLPYQSSDTWCSVTPAELWLAALPVTWHLVLCDVSRAVVGCPTSHLTPGALWRQQSCGWLPYQSPDTWCSVTSAELWLAALPVTWHLVLCDISRAVVGCPTSHLTPGALWRQQSCGWLPYQSPDTWCSVTSAELWLAALPVTWHLVLCDVSRAVVGCPTSHLTPGALWRQQSCGWLPYQSPDTWCSVTSAELWLAALPVTWHLVLCDVSRAVVGCPTSHLTPGALWCQQSCGWLPYQSPDTWCSVMSAELWLAALPVTWHLVLCDVSRAVVGCPTSHLTPGALWCQQSCSWLPYQSPDTWCSVMSAELWLAALPVTWHLVLCDVSRAAVGCPSSHLTPGALWCQQSCGWLPYQSPDTRCSAMSAELWLAALPVTWHLVLCDVSRAVIGCPTSHLTPGALWCQQSCGWLPYQSPDTWCSVMSAELWLAALPVIWYLVLCDVSRAVVGCPTNHLTPGALWCQQSCGWLPYQSPDTRCSVMSAELQLAALPVTWHLVLCDVSRAVVGCPTSHLTPGALWCQQSCGWLPFQSPDTRCSVMSAELRLAALPVTWHPVLCDVSRAVVGCPTSHLTPGALWCQQSCDWLPYQSPDTWCSVMSAELWLAALPVTWHLVLCDVSRAVVGCPTSHLTPGALWCQQSCGWLPYQSPHPVLCDISRAPVGCPTSHDWCSVMSAELWLAALPVTWHLVLCDVSRAVVGCPTSHLTPGALWCQQSCGWLPYQSPDTWCSVMSAELRLAALPVTWHPVLCDVRRAAVGSPTSHLTPGALWCQQSCGWLPYQSPDTRCSVMSAELWLAALPVTWHLVLCDVSRAAVGCPSSHLTPGALWCQQSCGWLPYQSPDTRCSAMSAELWLAALPVTWHLVLCDVSRAVIGCPTSHLTPGALWCQQSCGWLPYQSPDTWCSVMSAELWLAALPVIWHLVLCDVSRAVVGCPTSHLTPGALWCQQSCGWLPYQSSDTWCSVMSAELWLAALPVTWHLVLCDVSRAVVGCPTSHLTPGALWCQQSCGWLPYQSPDTWCSVMSAELRLAALPVTWHPVLCDVRRAAVGSPTSHLTPGALWCQQSCGWLPYQSPDTRCSVMSAELWLAALPVTWHLVLCDVSRAVVGCPTSHLTHGALWCQQSCGWLPYQSSDTRCSVMSAELWLAALPVTWHPVLCDVSRAVVGCPTSHLTPGALWCQQSCGWLPYQSPDTRCSVMSAELWLAALPVTWHLVLCDVSRAVIGCPTSHLTPGALWCQQSCGWLPYQSPDTWCSVMSAELWLAALPVIWHPVLCDVSRAVVGCPTSHLTPGALWCQQSCGWLPYQSPDTRCSVMSAELRLAALPVTWHLVLCDVSRAVVGCPTSHLTPGALWCQQSCGWLPYQSPDTRCSVMSAELRLAALPVTWHLVLCDVSRAVVGCPTSHLTPGALWCQQSCGWLPYQSPDTRCSVMSAELWLAALPVTWHLVLCDVNDTHTLSQPTVHLSKCIATSIDPVWPNCSALVAYFDSVVILVICASWLDS